MSARLRLTLAAGIATLLAASAIAPLFDSLRWVGSVFGCVLLITAVGALGRRLGVPSGLVPLVNLAALGLYVSMVFGTDQVGGILPSRATLGALGDELAAAATDIRQLAAPVPAHVGLVLVAVLCIGAVVVLVDVIAVALRRPALAGVPLLAVFAVPVGISRDGLGWLPFLLGTVGYLALLLTDGRERVSRWGRPFSARDPVDSGQPLNPLERPPLASSGRRIGAAAIGAGIVVPLLVPGLTAGGLAAVVNDGGFGLGPGGSHTARVINPITQLRGELTRSDPVELLRVETSDDQHYLRLTSLDVYQKNKGWTQSRLQASVEQRVAAGLPRPDIAEGVPTRRVAATVRATGLGTSQYLPTYLNPVRVRADGDWRYDTRSGTTFTTRTNTRDLTYSFTAVALEQGPRLTALMAASPDVRPESEVAKVYEQTPREPRIQQVVDDITAGQRTPYEKTLAIYQHFRDPANGFTYSLQTKAGNSGNALLDFLENKQGYCEQYASAMAIMARYAGVPARVAIGYTRGVPADGYRSITTDDAHAWVEVYFAGVGWTTWDPTPPSGNGRAQTAEYAPVVPVPAGGGDAPEAAGGSTTTVGGSTAAPVDPRLQHLQDRDRLQDLRYGGGTVTDPATAPEPDGHRTWWVLGGIVLALLVAPALVRPVLRARRMARARGADRRLAAHAAWDELRASAYDLGIVVEESDSPRGAAGRLERAGRLDPAARQALQRLVRDEEEACYAPVLREDSSLAGAVRTVRRALLREADLVPSVRARLLPPSTVALLLRGAGGGLGAALDRVDAVLDRVRLPRSQRG